MKKFGLMTLALMVTMGVFAQKGVEDGSRYGHGEDSINVIKNISIYTEYYKTNNFKDAYEQGWKEVFRDAPWASVNTYNYGVKILRNLYKEETDPEKKAQYSEELFQVYEQRVKYLEQLNSIAQNKVTEGDIWGQYGHDYMSYNPKVQISRAYELLRKAVDLSKGRTQYYVLNDLMKVSSQRYTNKKDNDEFRDALIQDYLDCATYIDEFIAMQTDDKILDLSVKVKESIDEYFVKSGAADCDRLQAIYGPKIEANKDNLDYLNKVVKIMSLFDCRASDAYFTAAEYAHAISPSVQTAKSLGYLYLKQREDTDKALEFYNQAIELDEDNNSIADTHYMIAALYMTKENYDRSRSSIQKCLSLNPNKGDAYILLGKLYAIKHHWTDEPALDRCAYYAVIDKFEQAKKVDPSVTETANGLIKQYKDQTPRVEDLFMLGYKAGDKVEVKGWINETVTIK